VVVGIQLEEWIQRILTLELELIPKRVADEWVHHITCVSDLSFVWFGWVRFYTSFVHYPQQVFFYLFTCIFQLFTCVCNKKILFWFFFLTNIILMLNSLELFFINILLKKKFLPSHFIIRKKTFFPVQNYK
jgi:membrane protease YdiL (CAAX protease family)